MGGDSYISAGFTLLYFPTYRLFLCTLMSLLMCCSDCGSSLEHAFMMSSRSNSPESDSSLNSLENANISDLMVRMYRRFTLYSSSVTTEICREFEVGQQKLDLCNIFLLCSRVACISLPARALTLDCLSAFRPLRIQDSMSWQTLRICTLFRAYRTTLVLVSSSTNKISNIR